MDIPSGFAHWTLSAMVLWVSYQLVKIYRLQAKANADLLETKSAVEKFLQPEIRFYVRDVLQRRIKMKDTEKVVAVIELDDAKGYATGGTFDQPPVWSVDDESIATLSPAADGMSCEIAGQKPGNAVVSVAGVLAGVSYAGTIPVPVTGGDPVAIKITLGAPVAQ